jgi:ABC-type polysaccharide/polyol phosphate export permease
MKPIDWKLFSSLLFRFSDEHFARSRLRAGWNVLTPLVLVCVVAWIFFDFFNFRSKEAIFAVLVGMIFWQWFQTTMTQGHRLFLDQRNFFKLIQTPRVFFVPAFVSFRALLAIPGVILVVIGVGSVMGFSAYGLLGIVLIVFWLSFILGLTYLCSTWTVFWPDLSHGLELALSLLLWLSPVFYSGNQVPESFQWLLWVNPLAWFLEGMRASLNLPHVISAWICIPLFGLFSGWILLFGFFYFKKHEKEFLALI